MSDKRTKTVNHITYECDKHPSPDMGFDAHCSRYSPEAYHVHFAGLGDMVRVATAGAARGDLFKFDFFSDPAWIGRKFFTFDDIVKATDSTWPEGVDRVEEMSRELEREQLPRPTVIKRRRVWNDYAGDEIDVDRYRSGEPFFRDQVRQQTPGPKVITFLVQVGQNAFMDSEKLFWRGALAVTLARICEDAGYRTEITAFEMGARTIAAKCSNLITSVNLKGAADALDVSSLVNATSGWFFRTVVFASFTAAGERLNSGLGSNQEATDKTVEFLSPGSRPWLVSGVYDKASSLKLARELLQTLVTKG